MVVTDNVHTIIFMFLKMSLQSLERLGLDFRIWWMAPCWWLIREIH